jgi:hypothetical protein
MTIPRAGFTIKDHHFMVFWSLTDEKKIEHFTKRMRHLHYTISILNRLKFKTLAYGFQREYSHLAEQMLDIIQRRHNDHHNAKGDLGHDWLRVEPLESPVIEDDMVTSQGLRKFMRIYNGETTGVFKWVGRGIAASTPHMFTTGLASETGTRLDSTTAGFHRIEGTSYEILANYGSGTSSGTIQQIGIFDALTSGLLFAIHDFGGQGQTHTVNADAFSLGMVAEYIPFGDF